MKLVGRSIQHIAIYTILRTDPSVSLKNYRQTLKRSKNRYIFVASELKTLAYTNIHIHAHAYTYIHIHIRTHTYTYIYVHIHTHTCTYTYIHQVLYNKLFASRSINVYKSNSLVGVNSAMKVLSCPFIVCFMISENTTCRCCQLNDFSLARRMPYS